MASARLRALSSDSWVHRQRTIDARMVVLKGSVDRHSQFVSARALLLSSEDSGDGVCSRAQVTFSLEPGHPDDDGRAGGHLSTAR